MDFATETERNLNFPTDEISRLSNSNENGNCLEHRKAKLKSQTIEDSNNNEQFDLEKYEKMPFEPSVRWPDLLVQLALHFGTLYATYLIFTGQVKLYTVLFALGTFYASGVGITAGAHRLWSHKAFKATLPFRIFLAFLFTITGQRDIYTWALDHRVHHKYSETVADPHDARRGFFFSHIGWLILTPHPAVEDRRKAIVSSCQDLLEDEVVAWQRRIYIPLFLLLNVLLPCYLPWSLWNETIFNSFFVSFVWRFTLTLNVAFCVNSVAHMWGNKPYDKGISPVENTCISIAALGEGYHNFHHVFPFDYRTSELGVINFSTRVLDLAAKFGLVYERKEATAEMIERRSARTGDGSRSNGEHLF